MKILIEEVKFKLAEGDFVQVVFEGGESKVFMLISAGEVIGLVNMETGATDYSVSDNRTFDALIDHMNSYESRKKGFKDVVLHKSSSCELKVMKEIN